MHIHRKQLMITSIATLSLALLLMISLLISYIQLVVFIAIFFLAISLIADSLALLIFFRQQEGIIQFARGALLLGLFLILLVHFLLK